MSYRKFIKTKGVDGANIGYFVPRMFMWQFMWIELRIVGLQFVKDRLCGWTIWWVGSEEDFTTAIKTLNELKKTHTFDYKIGGFF